MLTVLRPEAGDCQPGYGFVVLVVGCTDGNLQLALRRVAEKGNSYWQDMNPNG